MPAEGLFLRRVLEEEDRVLEGVEEEGGGVRVGVDLARLRAEEDFTGVVRGAVEGAEEVEEGVGGMGEVVVRPFWGLLTEGLHGCQLLLILFHSLLLSSSSCVVACLAAQEGKVVKVKPPSTSLFSPHASSFYSTNNIVLPLILPLYLLYSSL